jgi:hypothetical protein
MALSPTMMTLVLARVIATFRRLISFKNPVSQSSTVLMKRMRVVLASQLVGCRSSWVFLFYVGLNEGQAVGSGSTLQ